MTDIEEIRAKKKEIDDQLRALEEKDKALGIFRAARCAVVGVRAEVHANYTDHAHLTVAHVPLCVRLAPICDLVPAVTCGR
jgi:hypothetical protein